MRGRRRRDRPNISAGSGKERHRRVTSPAPDQELAAFPGLVIARYGASIAIEDTEGTLRRASSRRRIGDVVCGDQVEWQPAAEDAAVIVRRLPRRSLLARAGVGQKPKPLAANLDRIVVAAAVTPPLDEELIDRYLVAAETTGVGALVVLNKSDLLEASSRADIAARLDPYRALGYPVQFASARTGDGLTELARELRGHTSVIVGQSGVGKSSLVNALLPDHDIRTASLTNAHHGRHTTSAAVLYHLPAGGHLIDSPGVRNFGLGAIDRRLVERGFVEIRRYVGQCRFANCTHTAEPGCAVRAAVENGEITQRRYASYQKILESVAT